MRARHFEGHLPEGVVLDWTLGSCSGNPTSDATYGFVDTEGLIGPDEKRHEQYAIAALRVYEDGGRIFRRKVTCIGPLAARDYLQSRDAGELILDGENSSSNGVMAVRSVDLEVPERTTSEETIGRLLRLVLWKP